MKQRILFFMLVAVVGFTSSATAQKSGAIFGANVMVGAPLGDFRNDYRSAAGIEGFAGFGVSQNVYLTGTIGYQSYAPDRNSFVGAEYGRITMVPLKAGVRFYPVKNIFLTGNAGLGLIRDETIDARESRFAYDIGAGLKFLIFHASVHYDGWQRKNTNGGSNSVLLKLGIAIR